MAAEQLPRGVSIVHRRRGDRDVKLYQVRVTWDGSRELVGRFDTLRDARAALVIAQADILRGVFVPPSTVRAERRQRETLERDAKLDSYNVRALAADYLEHVRRMGRKQSTLYDYRRRTETHILPAFAMHPIEAVTPQEVQQWFDRVAADHGKCR